MNTPSPLVPQGTKPAKNKSTVRIAFFSILAVHVVFIGGLLIQGCSKDNSITPTDNGTNAAKTNADASMPADGNIAANPAPADPTAPTTAAAPVDTATPGAVTPVAPISTPVANTTPGPVTAVPQNTTVPAAQPVTTGATSEYTIAKGDTLGSIAKKNHISLKALQEANPNVNALRLQLGQKIQIPAGSAAVASTSSSSSADTASAGNGSVYTVKSGDRLANIAKAHGTTVKAIASLNGLKSVNSLKVGQKLKMPVAKSASTEAAPVSTPVPAVSATPTTTALAPTGQANN